MLGINITLKTRTTLLINWNKGWNLVIFLGTSITEKLFKIFDLWYRGSLPTMMGMMFLWNKSYKVHSMVTPVIKWMCFGILQMLDNISSLIHRLAHFNCSVPFIYINMILTCQTLYFEDEHEMPWKRPHFTEVTPFLLQPPRSKSRRWHLKPQCRDQTDSSSIQAKSQSLNACCSFLIQLSGLRPLPISPPLLLCG